MSTSLDLSVEGESEHLFAYVLERDVDFLLVEELSCSADFRAFLLGLTFPGLNAGEATWLVRHSVARTGAVPGETDIELTLVGGPLPGPVRLMIENKVDAEFQPEQAARYREEVLRSVSTGACWKAASCLLAPATYLASRSGGDGFDASISYEQIVGHLSGRAAAVEGELGARLRHRVLTLEQAIAKSRRGYTPVPHDGITDFWSRYWELANAISPSLKMERPSVRGGRSWWIRFSAALQQHPNLPNAFLIHKLERGRIQIEFPGWAEQIELLEAAVRESDAPFEIWPAGKSAAIAMSVPIVDPTGDFDSQVGAVRAGLEAGVRLQDWWRTDWRTLLEGDSVDRH